MSTVQRVLAGMAIRCVSVGHDGNSACARVPANSTIGIIGAVEAMGCSKGCMAILPYTPLQHYLASRGRTIVARVV
jgi:hypothetical protein